MQMSERVRDLRHRVAEIVGGVTGPQDYELDGAILAAFEEVAQKTERETLERAAQAAESFIPSGFASTGKAGNTYAVARDDRARTIAYAIRNLIVPTSEPGTQTE